MDPSSGTRSAISLVMSPRDKLCKALLSFGIGTMVGSEVVLSLRWSVQLALSASAFLTAHTSCCAVQKK